MQNICSNNKKAILILILIIIINKKIIVTKIDFLLLIFKNIYKYNVFFN